MKNINLKTKLEQLISAEAIKALNLCSDLANKLNLKLFLIGGAVRDIILGKNSFDIDVTVEGNAIEFAKSLFEAYPQICRIKEIHEKFTTAKVAFQFDSKLSSSDEIIIDFASTRKETYPYPASLPLVEEIGCSLQEDVTRRDFTINSIALSLNKADFGDIIDYLGGYQDLQDKIIRVLHNESFKDDPTRIIRALKFRTRFDCDLDKNTRILQEKTLESGMFDNLCGERIKLELKQTFNLNIPECTEVFMEENIYRLVDRDIKPVKTGFEKLSKIINEYISFIDVNFIWLIYLGVLLSGFDRKKISKISENLYLSGEETEILLAAKILQKKALLPKTAFEIYEFFEGVSIESVLVFLFNCPDIKENFNIYLRDLKNIRIFTTGQTLIDLGLKPGVIFGKILKKLLKAKINGEFLTEEEEKNYLINVILKNEV